MTTQNLALFKALGAKMAYLSQRQRVVSQNIANADTPNYRPQDLSPADFRGVLAKISGSSGPGIRMETTQAMHMPAANVIRSSALEPQKTVYEVSPSGNAVILEEQLINAGQTITDYNLMTSLYEKNVRMIQTALGRGQA